jgi:hypothetical protein
MHADHTPGPRQGRISLIRLQARVPAFLSPPTLEKRRSRGGGPIFVKLGRLVRYKVEYLEAWLAVAAGGPTSDPGAAPANL